MKGGVSRSRSLQAAVTSSLSLSGCCLQFSVQTNVQSTCLMILTPFAPCLGGEHKRIPASPIPIL